jgi:hypothetical protein
LSPICSPALSPMVNADRKYGFQCSVIAAFKISCSSTENGNIFSMGSPSGSLLRPKNGSYVPPHPYFKSSSTG